MILAETARALMEHNYLDTIEKKIIKAATNGQGKLELIVEDDHDADVLRECLVNAGYKIKQGYIDEYESIWYWEIIWSKE